MSSFHKKHKYFLTNLKNVDIKQRIKRFWSITKTYYIYIYIYIDTHTHTHTDTHTHTHTQTHTHIYKLWLKSYKEIQRTEDFRRCFVMARCIGKMYIGSSKSTHN